MKSRDAILIAVAAIGLGAIAWWTMLLKPAVEKPVKAEHSATKQKMGPVKVGSDREWSEVSEAELREFSSYFSKAKSRDKFELGAMVVSGEALLADLYEASPGEFVFTKLTPVMKSKLDGTNSVEVTIDSFSISSSGRHKKLHSHRTVEVSPRNSYTVGHMTEDGFYHVKLHAEAVENSVSLRLNATGNYQRRLDIGPAP